MAARKAIPKLIERQVYQEANNRCARCGREDLTKLRVHHIIPYSENPTHDLAHLVLLCLDCHDDADRGNISRKELYAMKKNQSNVVPFPKAAGAKAVNVTGDGNIVAGGNVHVEGGIHVKYPKGRGKKSTPPVVIPGTVATDARMIGYLEYLVRRYNEFKESACKRTGEKMNYAMIRVAYAREIKYKVKDTPLDLFDDAVAFLQNRIKNTALGRNLNARGQSLYSSFDDFDQQ